MSTFITDDAATERVPELDWTTRREAGVTLVELTVTNDADGPRRVRVRSAVPVLPPRSDGVPATGWTEADDDRVAVVEVPPDATRGLGYASPETAEPPAELVDAAPPESREAPEPVADAPDVEPTPDGVVRDLPGAGPPRDAVPGADGSGGQYPEGAAQEGPLEADGGAPTGGEGTRAAVDHADAVDAVEAAAGTDAGRRADAAAHPEEASPSEPTTAEPGANGTAPDSTTAGSDPNSDQPDGPTRWSWGDGNTTGGGDLPPAVADWLDGVARRIELAGDLATAGSGAEATALVAAAGGPGAVDRLANRVDGDPDRLRALAARAEELAERAEGVDVPEGFAQRSP